MDHITARLRLDYQPDTGRFYWRPQQGAHHDAWNKRYAGKRAGGEKTNSNGATYRYIKLDGQQYLEHRLAWIIMTGRPAPSQVDHRNRNGTDNRWCNLRDGSTLNSLNRGRQANNRSGATGACYHKRSGKWEAYVRHQGVKHHIGLFSSAEQAGDAARSVRQELGFDQTHGA